jgi:hypothetical protein
MECHEIEDIARGWIRHVDTRPYHDPFWRDDISDRAKNTLLHELLQLLIGHR